MARNNLTSQEPVVICTAHGTESSFLMWWFPIIKCVNSLRLLSYPAYTWFYDGIVGYEKFHLIKVYYKIPIEENNISKTTITTPFSLFEFTRRTFGLRKVTQSFQRLIDKVWRGLSFSFAYIDDVLIANRNMNEHTEHHL